MRARGICVRDYAKPKPGERVLDVGCGPGYVLDFLPAVDYVGIDVSARYIGYAEAKYGNRGTFRCVELTAENALGFGRFDLIMLNGVLHHIDDAGSAELLRLLAASLSDGGRVMTLDGCYRDRMSPVSRFLLDRDRGRHVRREEGYVGLAKAAFGDVRSFHRGDLFRFPYDALVMVCRH